jgi:hypothetical protein
MVSPFLQHSTKQQQQQQSTKDKLQLAQFIRRGKKQYKFFSCPDCQR